MNTKDDRIINIDGHAFQQFDDGIYKAKEPYGVDAEQWMFDEMHIGVQAIASPSKNGYYDIQFISVDGSGGLKLIKLFNSLIEKGEKVEYIEGAPSEISMGEIYA